MAATRRKRKTRDGSEKKIRKAIWSFWSKPFSMQRSFWKSEFHHLLSWVLSVQTARKHFSQTALYTDDAGKEMLIDGIGLEFDEVSLCLNDLDAHNPDLWCLGKLRAYSFQKEAFIHIDSDVFVWEPVPDRLLSADVLAQNAEAHPIAQRIYDPEQLQAVIQQVEGWLPEELTAYVTRDHMHCAFCCGIFGGCNLDFIRYYAEQSLHLVEEPKNRHVWNLMPDRSGINPLIEQYLLAACLEYHHGREASQYSKIQIECLFDNFDDAFARGDEVGFTHLIGFTKQDPDILARLERRVRTDHPAFYERCLNYRKPGSGTGSKKSSAPANSP